MCGFLVVVKSSNLIIDNHKIKNVINDLKARGPDHQASIQTPSSLFVSTRLAHRDLSDGANQPFRDRESNSIIAFNGEIINDDELRRDLIIKGVQFKTQSDTEVLLKGYLDEGVRFFSKIRGMFSFVIWDEKAQCHIIVRDWFGIKPLYFSHSSSGVVFSSVVKPIKEFIQISPNIERYMEYLTFGHVAPPNTLYKEVQHFPNGHIVTIDSDFKWKIDQLKVNESKLSLDQIFERNIKGHLKSDRQLGIQLSGGIDSTFILQESMKFSKKLKSYSVIVPDEENSEEMYQQEVLNKFSISNFSLIATCKDFFQGIDNSIQHLELPVHHLANVFFDQLFKQASTQTQGLLTGEGGDELFLGYKRYHYQKEFIASVFAEYSDPKDRMQKLFYKLRQVYLSPQRIEKICPDLRVEYPERMNILFSRDANTFLDGLVTHDLLYGLDSLLIRQDRLGMSHGLENRPPLICPDLFELNKKLISTHQIGKIDLKHRLKSNFEAGFIERKKKGFGLPIGTWLRSDQNFRIFENLKDVSFINKSELEREIRQLLSNDNESSKYLMRIYLLNQWLKLSF